MHVAHVTAAPVFVVANPIRAAPPRHRVGRALAHARPRRRACASQRRGVRRGRVRRAGGGASRRAREGREAPRRAAGTLAAHGRAPGHARKARRRDAHRALQVARSADRAGLRRGGADRPSVVRIHDAAPGAHQRQMVGYARSHARQGDAQPAARLCEVAAGRRALRPGSDLRFVQARRRNVRPLGRPARQGADVDGRRRHARARSRTTRCAISAPSSSRTCI